MSSRGGTKPRRYALVDRDGTIIYDKHYLARPDDVELLPGAATALRELQEIGFGIVVVTNQSGVRRGYFSEDTVRAVHARLRQLLLEEDVWLWGCYYCPHVAEDRCPCRKPNRGMVDLAVADLGLNPSESIVIGDKACDVALGNHISALSILVRTGKGSSFVSTSDVQPSVIADDLPAAVRWVRDQLG